MKLTPLDIRHKEFKRGMRGYTEVDVDEFLDNVADEFERGHRADGGRGGAAFGMDGHVQTRGLERLQGFHQFVDARSRHFGAQDAGELAAEVAHAAFEPVAAVAGHDARDGFDQPGSVRADEGHHQRDLHEDLVAVSGAAGKRFSGGNHQLP